MDYTISHRAASLSPSLTLAIDPTAKQMKAEGQDVVGFGAGEPDFAPPQHIKDAATKAIAEGFIAFGADEYIRLSYATSMANIEKGLGRLEEFVRNPSEPSASN